jgi:hypothetical protein
LKNDTTHGADGRLAQAFGDHGKQLIQDVRGTAKQLRQTGDTQAALKRQAAEIMRTRNTTRNVALGLGIAGGGADIVRHVVE